MQSNLLKINAFSLLLPLASLLAIDEITLSDDSLGKINQDHFSKHTSYFAEAPALFKNTETFELSDEIAFEDSVIRLTPGDVIKISEDLTFSYQQTQVAEEDFILSDDKAKNTNSKSKGIKFSRSPY